MKKYLILFALILIQGCSGGGGTTSVQDTTSANNSVKAASTLISPGGTCEFGGVEIESGIDTNSNGVLDANEVNETLVVCNGDSGYNSLISLNDEPAGNNCASGGVIISSGVDLNRNDILDGSEVDNFKYVCTGADGADGASSCSVSDNGDGTSTISCIGGTSVVISNGADGTDGTDGTSCSVSDNGDGTSTISCTDGTNVVVSDGADGIDGVDGTNGTNGTNGTDNAAIASIFCGGSLQNFPDIRWAYSVHQLSSGDVIASGEIGNSFIDSSQTNYYSLFQNGYTTASVLIGFDLLGLDNYGFWDIKLDRNTLVVSINYYDSDLAVNPTNWTMPPSECVLNSY